MVGVIVLEMMPFSALGPDAAELQVLKQQLRSRIEGGDVGVRETVSESNAREGEPLDRVAGEDGETGAVLVVVLDELRVDADRLTRKDGRLAGLVEFVTAGEDGEAARDRAVEKVRLGE